MRLSHLAFEGHPVLGDLALDFTDQVTGDAAAAVVFAGTNGSGKTVLLNEIYALLTDPWTLGCKAEATVILDDAELASFPGLNPPIDIVDKKIVLLVDPARGQGTRPLHVTRTASVGVLSDRGINAPLFQTPQRPLSVYYSEAQINFRAPAVSAITATSVDAGERIRRSEGNLATEIAQLLVDIRSADNEDLKVWAISHANAAPPPELVEGPRLSRFNRAVEYMFPSKRIDTVVSTNGHYEVRFIDGQRGSTLDQLSTGEKQILFRGGFFLRNLSNLPSAVLLIDEPELSLHPEWQARIVGFYRSIVPEQEGRRGQTFFATHSPFIVQDQPYAKVIILARDSNGNIAESNDATFAGTDQERVVHALNIPAIVRRSSKETVLLVEGQTDVAILEAAWAKLFPGTAASFDIQPTYSKSAMRVTLNEPDTFSKNPTKRIIGLFDFDTAYDDWNGVWRKDGLLVQAVEASCLVKRKTGKRGWAMLLPVPGNRSHLASPSMGSDSALSIEMLFDDAHHLPGMFSHQPLPSPGATKPIMKDSQKTAFANHAVGLDAAAFSNFSPIFQRISEIISGQL